MVATGLNPHLAFFFYTKGDTLEASKSAHLFELNTVKPMHYTDVNQVATDMLCHSSVQAMPAFQKTTALYMVLKQRAGQFPI